MERFMFLMDCGRVVFDSRDLALAFPQMLQHQISPEQWMDVVQHIAGPDAVDNAKNIATACVGTGA